MHTEADFRRKINRNPRNWTARLIFADWLQEQGDPRAAGYRFMAERKLLPERWHVSKKWYWNETITGPSYSGHLKGCWYRRIAPYEKIYDSRKEAEDAAAVGFSLLTPEQIANL